MLQASDIQRLANTGESETLELKVSTPLPESLGRLLSGFANGKGGTVLVGVREPSTIIGTDPIRFHSLVGKAIVRLQGKVDISHRIVEVDGKPVGVIEVAPATIPVASPDGYFRRVGDREQPLEVAQLVARMSALPDHSKAIETLGQTIALQTQEISNLRGAFEGANSWRRKAVYALLGAAATAIVKILLTVAGVNIG